MLNKEEQGKDIIELALAGKGIALDIRTMKVCGCNDISCDYCRFNEENYPYKQGNCEKNCFHWANSEYIEPKVFAEQEKAVLKALDKIEWIVKNRDGEVWGFTDKEDKPYKIKESIWCNEKGVCIDLSDITSCKFEAIKWEDTEPTSREEILNS